MDEVVQLNVRMTKALRDEGNDALRSVGLNPSKLVRTIWELAVRRGESLKSIVDLVHEEPVAAKALAPTDDPLLRGQLLYEQALRDLGISHDVAMGACQERSFDDMLEDALLDKWAERGLLDG